MKHLLIFFMVLTSFAGKANSKLDIIAKIPSELLPGKSYNVEVIINKGDLNTYAYFEHELPAGIRAEEAINDNADFYFEAGKVKLVWLKLPNKPRIKIIYKISVPKDTIGRFEVNGAFSYIINNKRGQVKLPSTIVSIGTPEDLIRLPVKPVQAKNPGLDANLKRIINIKREEPEYLDFDKSYSVILLIKKDTFNYPLTLEETIPTGYKASSLQTTGGKFSTKGNKLTFKWDKLPQEPYFTISYILKGTRHTPKKKLNVNGQYTYKIGKKHYAFRIDADSGKKPSLEDIRTRKNFMKPDTVTHKIPSSSLKDTIKKVIRNNTDKTPVKKTEIDEIKNVFN